MNDAFPPISSEDSDAGHVPVLPDAVLEHLAPKPGQAVFDATLGRGGHAALIIPHLAPGGVYLATDLDAGNLEHARDRLTPLAEQHGVVLRLHHGSFTALPDLLDAAHRDGAIPAPTVDGLLADLGFASNQVDDPDRGLSFKHDGQLDMRLNPSDEDTPTAADLVNSLPPDQLADLIYQFGEERLSRRIARKIAQARASEPIQTTGRLAQIVRSAYPPPSRKGSGRRKGAASGSGHRIDPATRTFQALRIAVNGELDALDALLAALPDRLSAGGRAVFISFHSLEDRRVKRAFLKFQQDELGQRLTRKPVTADDTESQANPRSRSAKLRAFEKTP